MAMGGTIYGCIETPWGVQPKEPRRHNVRVIEHLPPKDEYPPLIRKMFGITGPSVMEGAYDHDLIHYGATIKHLDPGYALEWIAKFESLLRRLVWYRAVMHIDMVFGRHCFHWEAEWDEESGIWNGKFVPIERWKFDDGGNPLVPIPGQR